MNDNDPTLPTLSSLYRRLKKGVRHFYFSSSHRIQFSSLRKLKKRVIFLLAIPRSGSTWLLDSLRSHSNITLHPRFWWFKKLNLDGRRYPRDLSNLKEGSYRLEVRDKTWKRIPQLKPISSYSPNVQNEWNIEKFHPHFYGKNMIDLANKIKGIKSRYNVELIYVIRKPKHAIASFLEYKNRNKTWYPHWSKNDIPSHMNKVFNGIVNALKIFPGPVVTFSRLKSEYHTVLTKLFKKTIRDTAINPSQVNEIYNKTLELKKSREACSSFVSSSKSTNEVIDEYDTYFSSHQSELSSCKRAFDSILTHSNLKI